MPDPTATAATRCLACSRGSCPDCTAQQAPEHDLCTSGRHACEGQLPLEIADDFGGRVQVMHGSVCVGLVVHDKPGLVLTPAQARMLAAMLTRQAEHAEATYA